MSFQWDDPSTSFSDLATPLEKGQVGVWAVAGFAYLVQIPLSVAALVSRRGHRLPFIFLVSGVILSFLGSLAFIASNILSVTIPFATTSSPVTGLIAATTISSLFNYWAAILLFVSIVHVLLDRQHTLSLFEGIHRRYRLACYIAFWIWVLVMFGLGSSAGSLFGVAIKESLESTTYGFFNDNFYIIVLAYQDSQISANSFLTATVLFVCGYTVAVYLSVRRAQIQDKITQTMIVAAMPVYVLYTIVNLTFTIFSSKRGDDAVDFAWAFLYNLFYIALTTILIILGKNRHIWAAADTTGVPAPVQQKSDQDADISKGTTVPLMQQQPYQAIPGPYPGSILLIPWSQESSQQQRPSIQPASPTTEEQPQTNLPSSPDIESEARNEMVLQTGPSESSASSKSVQGPV